MADPSIFTLTANAWVQVATAVQFGVLWPWNDASGIFNAPIVATYRMAGNPAPAWPPDGTEKRLTGPFAVISNDQPIDVYVARLNSDGQCTVCL